MNPPPALHALARERERLRAEKKYRESDIVRDRIATAGFTLRDTPTGSTFEPILYSDSTAVPSRLNATPEVDWSVLLLAHNNADEILRAAHSVEAATLAAGQSTLAAGTRSREIILVDNASTDDTPSILAAFAAEHENARLILLAEDLGEGAGRNAGLRACRGECIAILGGHMEIAGDIFTPLTAALADPSVGATGSNGLVSEDLFAFSPAPATEADAIEFYLFAFRRERLAQVGWLDEKYHFYRNIDLDWSMAFKDKGLRLVTVPDLPLIVHEHPFLRMDDGERDRLSKKNYRRFLKRWGERRDLLLRNRTV